MRYTSTAGGIIERRGHRDSNDPPRRG